MKKFAYLMLALALIAIPVTIWATSNTEIPDLYTRTVENSTAVGVGGGTLPSSPSSNNVAAAARNLLWKERVINYATTTTAKVIYMTESGSTFVQTESSNDPVTFNLPDAVTGLTFKFIDTDATAAADLIIEPKDSDKINNQTAGVSYNATGDAYGETVTLLAISSSEWVVMSKIGTWTTGS